MPYRICLISLGCAKNQVNSEQMLYLLNQAGHEVVGEVDGCDVAIVNTCGFIDSAKSEAIDQILQLAEVKKAGGLKKILVTGCLSQRYENDILESLPEVDGMLGTGSFGQICAAVEDVMHGGRPPCITSSTAAQIWPKLPVPSMPSTSGRLSRMSFSYRCDRQPVTRIFFSPPAFFTSASCRIWSMASLLALSIKPQVLTMATSHPSTSPTTSWPA